TTSPTAAATPDVLGRTWNLATITQTTPAFQGVIPAEQQVFYRVNFNPDGTFLARADCNQVFGNYTADTAGNLKITLSPAVLAYCGPDSFSLRYIHALQQVVSYAGGTTDLTLTLTDGSKL